MPPTPDSRRAPRRRLFCPSCGLAINPVRAEVLAPWGGEARLAVCCHCYAPLRLQGLSVRRLTVVEQLDLAADVRAAFRGIVRAYRLRRAN